MIGGPYQSKLTPYTGLPESTPTFTLSLMEELPQLIKNGLIFTDLLWVCSQFALNFFHFYFNHKFHTQGETFWNFFAVRAHIRIFLAFRICINFCPISKFEPAGPDLLWTFWKCSQSTKLGLFPLFWWSKFDSFYILPFFDQKQLSGPVLPLWEHERPLTRLSKAIFTFGLGPMVWPHEAVDYSAHKYHRQR